MKRKKHGSWPGGFGGGLKTKRISQGKQMILNQLNLEYEPTTIT